MRRIISASLKESILKKALSRGSKPLSDVAKENGVGVSTLSKWVRHLPASRDAKIPCQAEKFRHLQATASLNDIELGAYCRQHGLYGIQLKEWEKDFMKQSTSENKYKAENAQLRKKNLQLERELKRKEKALAEAAALIVLKKKAAKIWGEDEDA